MRKIHRYGWKRSLPDYRDQLYRFQSDPALLSSLPPAEDLRSTVYEPPIVDQLALGSCVGNGTSRQLRFLRRRQGAADDYTPSRLAIYYGARKLEGSAGSDVGCEPRDAFKVLASIGAGPEDRPDHPGNWPYDISRFAEEPSSAYYQEARQDTALIYSAVDQTEYQIKGALASGLPVGVGFSVFSSFESSEVAATGIVPMPKRGESNIGGHYTVIEAYDDARTFPDGLKRAAVANSWSDGWGDRGYFWLPWEYILNPGLVSDLWVLNVAS